MYSLAAMIIDPACVLDPSMFAPLDQTGWIVKSSVVQRAHVSDQVCLMSSARISQNYPKMQAVRIIRWP
jgi:hypothetical protein